MKPTMILRAAIVIQWILISIEVYLSFILESHLPKLLQEYLYLETQREPNLFILLLGGTLLLSTVISSIGLFFFKNWARWLYSISLFLLPCLYPYLGPVVDHSIVAIASELSLLCAGIVIGISFFSNEVICQIKKA